MRLSNVHLARTVISRRRSTIRTPVGVSHLTKPEPKAQLMRSSPSMHNTPSRVIKNPHRWWTNAGHYGSLEHFKTMIAKPQSDRETVLVALDTEGSQQSVTEIGITTLRVRDILGVPPGKHLAAWMAKMKHYHFVICNNKKYASTKKTPSTRSRLNAALFAKSRTMTTAAASAAVREIWQSLLQPQSTGAPATVAKTSSSTPNATSALRQSNIALIGHSLFGDIAAVRGAKRGIGLDLCLLDDATLRVTHVFDTYYFAHDSRLPFRKTSLAGVASSLDIDPRYRKGYSTIKGWHNASNDAAYTMLAALMLATRDSSEALWGPTRSPGRAVPRSRLERRATSRMAVRRGRRDDKAAESARLNLVAFAAFGTYLAWIYGYPALAEAMAPLWN